MENVTNTHVTAYTTRKEARKGAKVLGDGYGVAKLEDGTWVTLPVEYLAGVEDLGDTLPDTVEALEEDVRAWVLAMEDTPQEDTPEAPQEDGEEDGEEVPGLSPEEVEGLKTKLQALREEVRELEGILAGYQTHLLVTSTVQSPVALVRDIFLAFVTEDGDPGRRKDVVNKAVQAGVAPNTAKTQYQVNRKKLENGDPALLEMLEDLRSNLVGE